MRRLGRAVAGLGILLLLAGATMSFAGKSEAKRS